MSVPKPIEMFWIAIKHQVANYNKVIEALDESYEFVMDLLDAIEEISEGSKVEDTIKKIRDAQVKLEKQLVGEDPVGKLFKSIEEYLGKFKKEAYGKFDIIMDDPDNMMRSVVPENLNDQERQRWNRIQEKLKANWTDEDGHYHVSAFGRSRAEVINKNITDENEKNQYIIDHAYDFYGLREEIVEFKKSIKIKYVDGALPNLKEMKTELNDRRQDMRNSFDAIEKALRTEGGNIEEKLNNLATHLESLAEGIKGYKTFMSRIGYIIKQIFTIGIYGKKQKEEAERLLEGLDAFMEDDDTSEESQIDHHYSV